MMGEGVDWVDRVDWVDVPLGEVFLINPKIDHSFPCDYKVSFVPMKSVEAMTGKMDASDMRPIADVCKGYVQFCDGDVLLAKITPCMENGKIAIAKGLINGLGFGSTEFHVFRSPLPEAACWLFFYFLQSSVRRDARKNMTGSAGQLRVPKNYLSEIPLPLPPLVEQRAIVAKIEALFSELDKGVEQLETLRGQLKRYRQSVLKAAFEGKLTAAWRASSEQFPERLQAAEHAATYDTKNSNLPAGWRWTVMDSVLSGIQAGKSFRCVERPPEAHEVGVVKVSAVTWGFFQEEESKTCVAPDKVNEAFMIYPNDFLFSRANTIVLVGACVIVRGITKRLMLSDKILRFTFNDTDARYVLHWLKSLSGREEIERLSTGNQESMRNIGQGNIRKIPIPLAPLPEQHQIVAEIETRFSALDQLEQTVETGLKQAEALRQSILKKAFEGRLLNASERAAVRADPAYEPAEKLLERIRAEREKSGQCGQSESSGQSGQRGKSGHCGQRGHCGRAAKQHALSTLTTVSTSSTQSTPSTPSTPKRRSRL